MKKEIAIQQQPSAQTPLITDYNQRSWWQSLPQKQRDIIVGTAIFLGISVLALIAIKYGYHKYKQIVGNKTESKSFGEDIHATWAKQLIMAFENDGWWGTDVEAVRKVILDIPSKEDFVKVQKAYKDLPNGGNLVEDLTDELKATEFNEMLAILQAKPEKSSDAGVPIYNPYAWATRLYNAVRITYMGFPGTDEAAIRAVFAEMPSQQAFTDTEQAYGELYPSAATLEEDLDDDLRWTMDWRAIIEKKPSTA